MIYFPITGAEIGAITKTKPGVGAQKRINEVKKEPLLLVKAPRGILASSLLSELSSKRLQ